jgi:type VI secretion system secreted protein Hcp
MAGDVFLEFTPKIEGETTDSKLKGAIDVESWSWGAQQTGTFGAGGGGGAGKASPGDFHFVKKFDKASPNLFLAVATGEHFQKVLLTSRKAGGKQETFLKIELSDVIVSSYTTGGSGSGDSIPTDQISLNFAKCVVEYFPQDAKGAVGASNKKGYDFAKNTKV